MLTFDRAGRRRPDSAARCRSRPSASNTHIMKDRDDPRAALCVAVAAGRIAAVAATSVLIGPLPPIPVVLGLACAIGLSLTRRPAAVWFFVAVDLTLALILGLTAVPTTFIHIAIAGAAAMAGAALGVPGL